MLSRRCSRVRSSYFAQTAVAQSVSAGHDHLAQASDVIGLNPIEAFRQLGLDLVGDDSDGFLPLECAFGLSISATPDGVALLRWSIADGYYLCRDRFDCKLVEPLDGAVQRPAVLAPGKIKDDCYCGRLEVYYRAIASSVACRQGRRVRRHGAPTGVCPRANDQSLPIRTRHPENELLPGLDGQGFEVGNCLR